MAEETVRIGVGEGVAVTALRLAPEGAAAGWRFLYAPGAGSNLHDPFGAYCCQRLASEGVASVRFQFPYQEAGKRGPDRPPILEAAWRAAIEACRSEGERLVIGGRSMGGRIASQVVAAGTAVDALALFAYPLHPPGRPDQARDRHLASLGVPVLFCSGTRDAFGSPEELRAAAAAVRRATLHLLADADHGFAVPKSTARKREDVWEEATAAFLRWLRNEVDR